MEIWMFLVKYKWLVNKDYKSYKHLHLKTWLIFDFANLPFMSLISDASETSLVSFVNDLKAKVDTIEQAEKFAKNALIMMGAAEENSQLHRILLVQNAFESFLHTLANILKCSGQYIGKIIKGIAGMLSGENSKSFEGVSFAEISKCFLNNTTDAA